MNKYLYLVLSIQEGAYVARVELHWVGDLGVRGPRSVADRGPDPGGAHLVPPPGLPNKHRDRVSTGCAGYFRGDEDL